MLKQTYWKFIQNIHKLNYWCTLNCLWTKTKKAVKTKTKVKIIFCFRQRVASQEWARSLEIRLHHIKALVYCKRLKTWSDWSELKMLERSNRAISIAWNLFWFWQNNDAFDFVVHHRFGVECMCLVVWLWYLCNVYFLYVCICLCVAILTVFVESPHNFFMLWISLHSEHGVFFTMRLHDNVKPNISTFIAWKT